MKPEMKKLIIANLPYLLFVYLFGKLGQAYRLAEGIDLSQKLLHFADGCAAAFESAAPSFHPTDLLIGVAGAAALRLMVYCKGKNAKKYRKGVEYGSARWGGPKDIAPYIDPNFDNNILLTQTERVTMNNRPKDPKTARNKNVLVIGGSGSGKTRFFVKPNLMQCVSKDYPTSFVITDPKGSLIGEVGQLLIRSSYRVKVLNTINFSKSMKYNPFRYLHSEKDVLKLVNTLICNTKGEGEKSAEDFWVKSERLFYTALIGYIWQEAPEEEMNFTTLLEMINASEAREDDPEFQSPVDLMFERLEERDPDHFAVRQYKKFLLSAGKTRSSILISAGARMAPFDIREVRELMEDDELELDTIGDEKTALFLIMSDTDTTFNFILAMVQSQLINLLCDRADDKYGGRLPVHVRMILDEFANIGQIPNFDKLIATIRSREISASIILQSQSQLKAIYKDAAEIISDNCDCTLFLSGRGKNAKEISDVLGKETIDSYNQSENRGAQTSHGLNYQKLGKELMSQDEIATMDGGKCILQVRGVRPFFSEKYDITRHPRYKYLSDADGILIPGGFGDRGIEGKILAAKYARENKIPYFGICLGMQIAVIEYARDVLGLDGANSTEFNESTLYPVINIMDDQKDIVDKGATMRLGSYECALVEGSRASKAYGQKSVRERHRHRFEFNNAYRKRLEDAGLVVAGINPKRNLVEIVEVKDHPWMVGVQFHPEFQSKPSKPHPLFCAFVGEALKRAAAKK